MVTSAGTCTPSCPRQTAGQAEFLLSRNCADECNPTTQRPCNGTCRVCAIGFGTRDVEPAGGFVAMLLDDGGTADRPTAATVGSAISSLLQRAMSNNRPALYFRGCSEACVMAPCYDGLVDRFTCANQFRPWVLVGDQPWTPTEITAAATLALTAACEAP